jgi:hypothetical protein
VDDAIKLIVTFCVAGGVREKIEFGGEVGANLSLRKLDAGGLAKAEIKVTKSARGLFDGLNKELNQYSVAQASEARKCMPTSIEFFNSFCMALMQPLPLANLTSLRSSALLRMERSVVLLTKCTWDSKAELLC